jgi:hypothetical protein
MSRLHTRLFPIVLTALTITSIRCADESGPTRPSGPNVMSVASVSPATGPTVGANAVRIIGSAFQSGAHVTVDGADVPATVQNGSLILVTMPPHDAGVVDIVVTNPSGQSASVRGGYTYMFVPPPVITSVQPLFGATRGGTPVTITGSGFRTGASISIGGAVSSPFVQSANTIYVRTHGHVAGMVDVRVTNPDGQSTVFDDGFAFVDPSTFDFNGDWEGGAYSTGMADHVLFRLKVRDNVVLSVTCLKDVEIPLSPAPQIKQGEFTFTGSGGTMLTGMILGPDYAEGAINIPPCVGGGWEALKRSSTTSVSGR